MHFHSCAAKLSSIWFYSIILLFRKRLLIDKFIGVFGIIDISIYVIANVFAKIHRDKIGDK